MKRYLALALTLVVAMPAWGADQPTSGKPPSGADAALITAATAAMVTNPTEALAIARRLEASSSDPLSRVRAQWLQGEALSRSEQPERAEAMLDKALATVRRLAPSDSLEGEILLSRAAIAEDGGHVADAFSRLYQAHTILKRTGPDYAEAQALMGIGGIYQDAGDYARALRYYAQANEVYSGSRNFQIATHNNIGETLRMLGRYRAAEAQNAIALRLSRAAKSSLLEAQVLINLATIRTAAGEFNQARRDAERALALAQEGDAVSQRSPALASIATVAARGGHFVEAGALMDRAFAGVDLGTTSLAFLLYHQDAANIYAKLNRPDLAYRHLAAFKRLDDGRRALAANANNALMAARFDFSNQNAQISQLQVNRARLLQVILLVVLGAASLLSVGLGIGLFYLRRSRNRERVANGELSRVNVSLEQALRARSDFLAVTSHEIRTPLNGILGMTQVLLADRATAGPLRTRLQVIHGAGEAMRTLVDDILDLSKLEAGKLVVSRAPVALPALLDGLVCLWRARAEAKGLTLQFDPADCPAWIEEDGDRLRQVLMNLLSNAVKFTDAGTIRLCVTPRDTPEAEIEFAVSDTGIGIAADQRDKIFENFTQADASTSRRFGGTGLGLAISRSLADTLGGRLTLDPAIGAGSTFRLTLPWQRLDAPIATSAEATDTGYSILLLEPNPLHRRLLAKALAVRTAAIVTVDTAEAAHAELAQGHFAEVIVQAALPDDDRQAALARLAQAAQASGALCFVMAAPDDGVTMQELPGALLVAKPVTGPRLVEALAAVGLADAA